MEAVNTSSLKAHLDTGPGVFWQKNSQTQLRNKVDDLMMLVWGCFALECFIVSFLGMFFCVSPNARSHVKRHIELLHLSEKNCEHCEFIIDPWAKATLQHGVNFKHVRHPSGGCFITKFNWVCHRAFTKETEKNRQINHSDDIWSQFSTHTSGQRSPACTLSEH